MKSRRRLPALFLLIALVAGWLVLAPREAEAQSRGDRSTDGTSSAETNETPAETPSRRDARATSRDGSSGSTQQAEPARRDSERERSRSTARTPQSGSGETRGTPARTPQSGSDDSRAGTPQSRDDRSRTATRPGRDGAVNPPATTPDARDRSPDRGRQTTTPPQRDVRQDANRRVQSNPRPAHRPVYRYTPPIYVHPVWPWHWRFQIGWSPRFRYRQHVYIDVGWAGNRRDARIEVETIYRHYVRGTTRNRADIDIYIERIALYRDGRFIGEVDQIPPGLARIKAEVYRNGRMRFDRDVFLVGDWRRGFDLISTQFYDGHVLDYYRPAHGYRAGRLDFRRHRVVAIGRSRFFDPRRFNGYVPFSLLPEDSRWLLDVGRESISGYYYGGWSSHALSGYAPDDRRYMEMDEFRVRQGDYDPVYREEYFVPDARTNYSEETGVLQRRSDSEIRTQSGAVIQLRREEAIEPVQDE